MNLKDVPIVAAHKPKIKYKVPISLWLVENNHRSRRVTDKSIKL
jgi:hypothetical protein